MGEEVSDPFAPVDPFVVPASAIPSYSPASQGPKTHRFQCANVTAQLTFGQGEIQVDQPCFVRLNELFNAAGTVYAPVAETLTREQSVWITAYPKGWGPGVSGASRTRPQPTIRGGATLLWLPHAGVWTIEFTAQFMGTTAILAWEISVVPAPAEYLGYLTNPAPTRHAAVNTTLPITSATHIGTLLTLNIDLIPNWFSMVSLRVQSDSPAAGVPRIANPGDGTLTQGGFISSFSNRVYTWQELSGSSIWLINSDGAAASQIINIEAHFL